MGNRGTGVILLCRTFFLFRTFLGFCIILNNDGFVRKIGSIKDIRNVRDIQSIMPTIVNHGWNNHGWNNYKGSGRNNENSENNKNSKNGRGTAIYGHQWNQPYLTFTAFTSSPSTILKELKEGSAEGSSNSTSTATLGEKKVPSAVGTVAGGDMSTLKKEIISLKTRLEKVEKNALVSVKKRTGVSNFVDSLQASTLAMNAKTVEICAVVTFFTIGTIVGASLLDRLWLLGGIFAAWWSSGAVHRDTRGGMLARRVGVQVAQLIRDIQEKYNQFVIFYRTGKLAYISSKTWEQYDAQYSISLRMNELKRLAMRRATDFKSSVKGEQLGDQLSDFWQVVISAPTQARKIDREYGVTSTVSAFSRGVLNTVSDGLDSIINRGSDQRNTRNKSYKTYGFYNKNNNRNKNSNNNNKNSKNTLFGFLPKFNTNFKRYGAHYRGQLINPWRPFWQFLTFDKKEGRRRLSWFRGQGGQNNYVSE